MLAITSKNPNSSCFFFLVILLLFPFGFVLATWVTAAVQYGRCVH